jgi:hypothetical protein
LLVVQAGREEVVDGVEATQTTKTSDIFNYFKRQKFDIAFFGRGLGILVTKMAGHGYI